MFFADPGTCTSADLNSLSDPSPDSASGFHGVFPHRQGWYSDFFHARLSPYCSRPREAARYACAWWRAVYGPNWVFVFRGRKAAGWQLIRDPSGEGYRVLVSVVKTPGLSHFQPESGWGKVKRAVVPRPVDGSTHWLFHPPGLWYLRPKGDHIAAGHRGKYPDWLTAKDGREAYRRWVWQTFGLFEDFAGVFVRRDWRMLNAIKDDPADGPAGSPVGRKMAGTLAG